MGAHDEESYDLFRQAIGARDADAWATLHSRYRPMTCLGGSSAIRNSAGCTRSLLSLMASLGPAYSLYAGASPDSRTTRARCRTFRT